MSLFEIQFSFSVLLVDSYLLFQRLLFPRFHLFLLTYYLLLFVLRSPRVYTAHYSGNTPMPLHWILLSRTFGRLVSSLLSQVLVWQGKNPLLSVPVYKRVFISGRTNHYNF